MLHTIVASFIAIVIIVGVFVIISLIRDKMMGPEAPRYFAGCDSCRQVSDCGSCPSAAECRDAGKRLPEKEK